MNYLKARGEMKIDPSERARFIHEQNLKQIVECVDSKSRRIHEMQNEKIATERILRARQLNSRLGQNVDVKV